MESLLDGAPLRGSDDDDGEVASRQADRLVRFLDLPDDVGKPRPTQRDAPHRPDSDACVEATLPVRASRPLARQMESRLVDAAV
jgi:hypothetical protein